MLLTTLTVLVLGGGIVAAAAAYLGGGGGQVSAKAQSSGCVLIQSRFGYPDRYLTKRVQYTVHPPLPVSGWRGRDKTVPFDMLFHSVFHGYIVVEYRSNLPPRTLVMLRSWVRRHAAQRVTSAPAAADASFAVDIARWGYDLRCSRDNALTARKLDHFLALRSTS